MAYTKVGEMTGDRTLQSAGVRFVSNTGVSAAFGASQTFGNGLDISYTASTDSYSLKALDNTTAAFGPSEARTSGDPNTKQWFKPNGTVAYDQLFLTVPKVNGVTLSYTVIGEWSRYDGMQVVNRVAVAGAPTLAGDMPRSGTATYSAAVVSGNASQANKIYALDASSVTFSADFASNAVTTALTMAGTPLSGGTVTTFGTFNGTGTINGTGPGFSGTFTGTGLNPSAFSGAFFGPKAIEMAYGWYISSPDFTGGGIVAGVKQ